MHIPDGYLGPTTYVSLWGVMLPAWAWASRQVRKTLNARQVPLLAIGAAFCFVLMMFNVPAPGGTSGHAVGSTLVALVLGPWAAVIAVSIALTVQALLFGDGGVTALAANCFNMAFVMPMTGWVMYRLFTRSRSSLRWRVAVAATAGYLSLGFASFCTALELGLQPLLAHQPDGTPLYCPYSWKITVPAMLGQHLFFFGWIEAIVTGLVFRYLLLHDSQTIPDGNSPLIFKPFKPLLWGLGILVVATPLGTLAKGTAWGEWASQEVFQRLGFIPQGLQRLEGLWNAEWNGYTWLGHSGAFAFFGSAVLGVLAIAGAASLGGYFLTRARRRKESFFERTLSGVSDFLTSFFVLEDEPRKAGLLQKIDPRVKLVTLLLLVVFTTFTSSLRGLLALYGLTLLLAVASRLSLRRFVVRNWMFIPFFTAAMVFPWVFKHSPSGTVLWKAGPFVIYRQNARLAAVMVARVATAISWSLLLVQTTRWTKLFAAFEVLRVPRVFVWTFQMMVRYLQTLVRQLEEFQHAVRSRAVSPLNVRQGQKVVTHHIGTLFQKSFEISDDVYAAMRSRGYSGETGGQRWWPLGSRDYAWLISWALVVALWWRLH